MWRARFRAGSRKSTDFRHFPPMLATERHIAATFGDARFAMRSDADRNDDIERKRDVREYENDQASGGVLHGERHALALRGLVLLGLVLRRSSRLVVLCALFWRSLVFRAPTLRARVS